MIPKFVEIHKRIRSKFPNRKVRRLLWTYLIPNSYYYILTPDGEESVFRYLGSGSIVLKGNVLSDLYDRDMIFKIEKLRPR